MVQLEISGQLFKGSHNIVQAAVLDKAQGVLVRGAELVVSVYHFLHCHFWYHLSHPAVRRSFPFGQVHYSIKMLQVNNESVTFSLTTYDINVIVF